MTQVPESVQRAFAQVFRQFENENRKREYAAVKADPIKHAMTRVMENGTGYTYFPAGERKLSTKLITTSICVARSRNAAGNFLIWRQVDTYTGREIVKNGRLKKRRKWKRAERFDFRYAPGRREAKEIAGKWAARLLAEAAPETKQ